MNVGPYATSGEALADAIELMEETARVFSRLGRTVDASPGNAARGMLMAALDDIELGAYDERIVEWLKTWDTETLVVLAGIIERAKALVP